MQVLHGEIKIWINQGNTWIAMNTERTTQHEKDILTAGQDSKNPSGSFDFLKM